MDNHPKRTPVATISDESFNNLIEILEHFLHLSKQFKAQLRLMLFEVTYDKGINILGTGAKQNIIWFTLDGLLREISVDENTFSEKTSWFWFALTFIYAVPGFFDQEPSQVNIKVVKNSKLIFISYDNWKALKDNFAETDKLTEMIRSEYEVARKLHAKDINDLSTTERYLKKEAELNMLFPYIQLKYIAEYMGMSTDTLGKLRRRFKNSKTPLSEIKPS